MSAADEQAREVEVVARESVLAEHSWIGGDYYCSCGHELNSSQGFGRHLLEEMEPVLAAERQEAAREALLAAADAMEQRAWTEVQVREADLLRDRADGVTGRSET